MSLNFRMGVSHTRMVIFRVLWHLKDWKSLHLRSVWDWDYSDSEYDRKWQTRNLLSEIRPAVSPCRPCDRFPEPYSLLYFHELQFKAVLLDVQDKADKQWIWQNSPVIKIKTAFRLNRLFTFYLRATDTENASAPQNMKEGRVWKACSLHFLRPWEQISSCLHTSSDDNQKTGMLEAQSSKSS